MIVENSCKAGNLSLPEDALRYIAGEKGKEEGEKNKKQKGQRDIFQQEEPKAPHVAVPAAEQLRDGLLFPNESHQSAGGEGNEHDQNIFRQELIYFQPAERAAVAQTDRQAEEERGGRRENNATLFAIQLFEISAR